MVKIEIKIQNDLRVFFFLGRREENKKNIDDKPPILYYHVPYHKKKDVVMLPITLEKKRVVRQEVLLALLKKHGRLTYVKEHFEYTLEGLAQLVNCKVCLCEGPGFDPQEYQPVTPVVPYLPIGLTGCSVGPRISCGARKLARTSRSSKKEKKKKEHFEYKNQLLNIKD